MKKIRNKEPSREKNRKKLYEQIKKISTEKILHKKIKKSHETNFTFRNGPPNRRRAAAWHHPKSAGTSMARREERRGERCRRRCPPRPRLRGPAPPWDVAEEERRLQISHGSTSSPRRPPPPRRARGGGHGGSRRPPPPRARWPELDSAPPRRARRAAREQGGVGVGRRDVERREGGRRRPGCSAEPMTPRSERERRGIWWRARETERARREISRRRRREKKQGK